MDSELYPGYSGFSSPATGSYLLHIIVGAIVVGLLVMLFIWLLPVIGFLFVAGLVVLMVLLIIWGVCWLVNAVALGAKQMEKKGKSAKSQ